MTSKAQTLGPLQVVIGGICALILSVGIARFAYTPLLPIMQAQAGLSTVMGGWLATFNYIGYLAGVLLVSAMHRLPAKYVLYRFNLLLAIVTTSAMGWTQQPLVWAVLRVLSGISSTAGILLAAGFVLNWLSRQGHHAELGVHFSGLGIGICVSGLAVLAMAGQCDWAQQWQLFGALGFVFLWPAWCWVPAPDTSVSQPVTQLATGRHARWMWWMVGMYFCAGFGYVIGATFIVAILEKLPALQGHGAWVWVMLGLAAAPAPLLWDRIARKHGELPALQWVVMLQLAAMTVTAGLSGLWVNVLAAMVFGNTFAGVVSLTLAFIGRRFPANPAKAMARLTLSYGIAQIVGPAVAAHVSRTSGSYRGSLWLAIAMMAVCWGVLWYLKKARLADNVA